MVVERVQLHLEFGLQRQRRWVTGSPYGPDAVYVMLGRLKDERPWADRTGDFGGAYVFNAGEDGDRQARELAEQWMADGRRWRPVPACYDGYAQPADGLPWVKRGNDWVLPESDDGS